MFHLKNQKKEIIKLYLDVILCITTYEDHLDLLHYNIISYS